MYIVDNVTGNSAYAEQIYALEAECFPGEAWSAELIKNELSAGRAVYLACFWDNILVSYLNATIIPGEAELNRLAVKKAFRRNGIATILLDKLKELVKESGGSKINLEVRKSNLGARNLYKAHGYVEDAVRTNYYHNPDDDAVLMSLGF